MLRMFFFSFGNMNILILLDHIVKLVAKGAGGGGGSLGTSKGLHGHKVP